MKISNKSVVVWAIALLCVASAATTAQAQNTVPKITINPTTFSFGQVALDAPEPIIYATISLADDPGGYINLSALGITDGPFIGSLDTCPTILNNGSQCTFSEGLNTSYKEVVLANYPVAFYLNGTKSYLIKTLTFTATVEAVPEPSTYLLMLAGLAFVWFAVRKKFAPNLTVTIQP
jgi:PEP-CTERM motif